MGKEINIGGELTKLTNILREGFPDIDLAYHGARIIKDLKLAMDQNPELKEILDKLVVEIKKDAGNHDLMIT